MQWKQGNDITSDASRYRKLRLHGHMALKTSGPVSQNMNSIFHRVATAQGKQGIWLLTFLDRENTGNSVNLIFYTGKKLCQHRENFENLEFFENFVIKVATR